MGPIDLLIFILLGLGLIIGFFRGFVRQISGLAGLIGGGIAAYLAYGLGYVTIAPIIGISIPPWAVGLVCGIIAFFLVALFFGLLGRIMKKSLKTANLSGVDRLIGAGLGFVKSIVMILLVLMLLMMTPLKAAIIAESESEPVLSLFTGTAGALIDLILGAKPTETVMKQLEYWGFDRDSYKKILQHPDVIFELAKTPKFISRETKDTDETAAKDRTERFQEVRDQNSVF